MIARSFDPDILNYLVNHPKVRPYVGGDITQTLDMTGLVADDQNHFLLGEHGGFFLGWSCPNSFEVHTFILPEGRGKWARAAVEAMKDYAGKSYLWTRIAPEARNVKIYAMQAGFKPAGTHRADFGAGPVDYLIYDWRR